MDHIMSQIWLGNKEAAFDHNTLIYHNIHYILNCTPDLPNKFTDMKYYRVPIKDKNMCDVSCGKQMFEYIFNAFKFIDEALNNNSGILVHCKRGHHRSANIILFYLVYKYNIGYMKAMLLINQIRPTALVRNTCINNWGMLIYKKIILIRYIQKQNKSNININNYVLTINN